jgi:hypothetical protein
LVKKAIYRPIWENILLIILARGSFFPNREEKKQTGDVPVDNPGDNGARPGECGDILTIPGEKDGGNIKISCRYPVENHRSSCGKR